MAFAGSPGEDVLEGGPSDAPESVSIIKPAVAYDEPDFTDVVLPAGVWTRLAMRDFSRAAFVVLRTPGIGTVLIQPGTNRLAVPFTMQATDGAFVLRYVDFLTIVTGDFFGFSGSGETVTVGTIRQH